MSRTELANIIQELDPAFFQMLMERDVTSFKPDPQKMLSIIRDPHCHTCAARNAARRCTGCRVARYCGEECQRLDWEDHRRVCALNRVMNENAKSELFNGHLDEN